MIIETHAHLSHRRFEGEYRYLDYDRATSGFAAVQGDIDALFEAMRRQDIAAVIEPAIDIDSNRRVLDMIRAHPGYVFAAVGLHPTRTHEAKRGDRAVLRALSRREGVVAIGEAGLDFHYPRAQQHRACQYRWFVFQILLAHRRRLPLILHVRQADAEALRVLGLFRPLLHGGVAHCFQGPFETAEAFLRLGFHLGIGGTLLQASEAGEALRETVRRAPLEKLLLETDAPYVHPTCDAVPSAKQRSKVRNTPLILPAVAAGIAALKGLDAREVERRTAENAVRLFGLHGFEKL